MPCLNTPYRPWGADPTRPMLPRAEVPHEC